MKKVIPMDKENKRIYFECFYNKTYNNYYDCYEVADENPISFMSDKIKCFRFFSISSDEFQRQYTTCWYHNGKRITKDEYLERYAIPGSGFYNFILRHQDILELVLYTDGDIDIIRENDYTFNEYLENNSLNRKLKK